MLPCAGVDPLPLTPENQRHGIRFSQYLSDVGKHKILVGGETDLRLFRDPSLSIDAGGSKVGDQIYFGSISNNIVNART